MGSVYIVSNIISRNTYKSRGVVIPDGLGVSESLEDRVGLNNLILQIAFLRSGGALVLVGTDGREVGNHLLRVLGLAGSGLATIEVFYLTFDVNLAFPTNTNLIEDFTLTITSWLKVLL
jgi:hypothetical protein